MHYSMIEDCSFKKENKFFSNQLLNNIQFPEKLCLVIPV